MATTSLNYGTISFGEYVIQNNAYNYQSSGNPPESISGPPGEPIGWTWDWPGNDNSVVMAYPEIIFGKKPFNPESTTLKLPRMVSAIQTVCVDYSLAANAIGSYNAAFDLWLTNSAQADPPGITAEIMIWVSRNTLNPAGRLLQPIDSPYGTVNLYQQAMNWTYFAFVLPQDTLTASLDLKFFLDALAQQGLIATTDYLASVEFGNEIAYGQGQTTVNSYAVTIQ